jgi:hypothetical protein
VFNFSRPISTPAHSSCIVMIINEVSHKIKFICIDVFRPLNIITSNTKHVFSIKNNIPNLEKEWIIKNSIHAS